MFRHALFCSVILIVGTHVAAVEKEVNLRGTPVGKSLKKALDALPRFGNKGETNLTKLVFDTTTKEVKGTIVIQAGYSWGPVTWFELDGLEFKQKDVDVGVYAEVSGEWVYNTATHDFAPGISIPIGQRSLSVAGQDYSYDFGELKLSSDTMRRIMDGDLAASLELFPSLGVVKKDPRNNYYAVKKRTTDAYGEANVYFSSKDNFVDKVSPSAAGNAAISLILSGGATSEAVMKAWATIAANEGDAILTWLKDKGVDAAQDIAKQLLNGKQVVKPDYYIAVKPTVVLYESRTLVLDQQIGPWVPENHGAFYIVIRKYTDKPIGDDPPPSSVVVPPNTINNPPANTTPNSKPNPPTTSNPGITPNPNVIPPGNQPIGIAASEDGEFKVVIRNESKVALRIKSVRFSEDEPVLFSWDFKPGASQEVLYYGRSERVFAAWTVGDGILRAFKSVPITSDVVIVFRVENAVPILTQVKRATK